MEIKWKKLPVRWEVPLAGNEISPWKNTVGKVKIADTTNNAIMESCLASGVICGPNGLQTFLYRSMAINKSISAETKVDHFVRNQRPLHKASPENRMGNRFKARPNPLPTIHDRASDTARYGMKNRSVRCLVMQHL